MSQRPSIRAATTRRSSRHEHAGRRSDPVCLYLETTNRCNLLCTTCPRTYADSSRRPT